MAPLKLAGMKVSWTAPIDSALTETLRVKEELQRRRSELSAILLGDQKVDDDDPAKNRIGTCVEHVSELLKTSRKGGQVNCEIHIIRPNVGLGLRAEDLDKVRALVLEILGDDTRDVTVLPASELLSDLLAESGVNS